MAMTDLPNTEITASSHTLLAELISALSSLKLWRAIGVRGRFDVAVMARSGVAGNLGFNCRCSAVLPQFSGTTERVARASSWFTDPDG